MVEVKTRRFPFTKRSFWFVETPFDVDGCDAAFFYAVERPPTEDGFECHRLPTMLIDLAQDEDTLRGRMTQSCRYKVKRAARDGVEVAKNRDVAEFHALYTEFVDAKGFEGQPEHFWPLAEQGTVYTWYFRGRLQGGLLVLEDGVHARWLMSGSRRLETHDPELSAVMGRGNRLIIWEAIRDAKARGLRWFDLGGHYDGPDERDPRANITDFKRGFGGEPVERYSCAKYYSRLYRLAKRLRRLA